MPQAADTHYTFWDGVAFLKETLVKEIESNNMEDEGVITDGNTDKFIACIAKHRFWKLEEYRKDKKHSL